MLELIDYDNIRTLSRDGWSVRRIAKHLNHSRETVRKALEWDGTPLRYHLTKPRPNSSMTPEVIEFVKVIIKKDVDAPRKQRHTALQIHDGLALRFPGHPVGESTVRRLVKGLLNNKR